MQKQVMRKVTRMLKIE